MEGFFVLRLADEQVNVFRHDDISGNDELISPARLLQDGEKQISTARRAQHGLPPVTTAGDEMQVSGAVVSLQVLPHGIEDNGGKHGGNVTGTLPASDKRVLGAGGPLLEKREKWRTPRVGLRQHTKLGCVRSGPPAQGKSPLSLDDYLSWMSPGFPGIPLEVRVVPRRFEQRIFCIP